MSASAGSRSRRDQEGREGIFHDVPESLPGLLFARKVQRRVVAVGYDWPDLAGPLAKVRRGAATSSRPRSSGSDGRIPRPSRTAGWSTRSATSSSRPLISRGVLNVDPELALRQTTRKFVARVERAVALAAEQGEDWRTLSLDDQERYYAEAKELLS